MADLDQDRQSVAELAGAHGLSVDPGSISFNEIGLDFRIGFATAVDGRRWVLRMPRRADVMERAEVEARALELVGAHLALQVPDWQIFADRLIAYPMLDGEPGLTFDPVTHEVTWHFDQSSPLFAQTLGAAIAALHAIDPRAARDSGLPVHSPDDLRRKWAGDLERVEEVFDVASDLLAGWKDWIGDDSYWPDFTVPIHGDLYVGHVMVDRDGRATGIIDWTEARVGDPAVDLAGHVRAFGEDALGELVEAYVAAGGRRWPRMEDHCRMLAGASALNYGVYAIDTGDAGHRAAAQAQLKPER